MKPKVSLFLLALSLGGCELRLGHPEYLWLLWLVPALALFYSWSFARKRRLLARFAAPELLGRLLAGVNGRRRVTKAVLVVVAFLALALSLTEPKYGFSWEEAHRRGSDIVVALDLSDSMLVKDGATGDQLTRLERARRELTDLLRRLSGDRIGLVGFAGSAFLHCPLTSDYGALAQFVDSLAPDVAPEKGTDLGAAIRTALAAFEGGGAQDSRTVLLITDGEDNAGDALAAAQQAKDAGIRIFAIGIGRDEGAPVPAPDGGFRRTADGELVLSHLDEATLQHIAQLTGGGYVRSVTGDVDLEAIYEKGIRAKVGESEGKAERRRLWHPRHRWLIALAALALAVEALLGERKRSKAGARVAAMLVFAWATPAGAAKTYDDPYAAYRAGAYDDALKLFSDAQVDHPDEPALAYNVGNTQYRQGKYAEAEQAFALAASSSADKQLKARALYNAGNAAARAGKLDRAVQHYEEALKLTPQDQDAKHNLETVRRLLEQQKQQQKQQQDKQQQDKQQQDKQQQDKQQQDKQQQDKQQQDKQQQDKQQQDKQQQGQQDTQEPQGTKQDRDGDGLSDALEQQTGTNPQAADSDGDGRPDGAEDRNKNGKVDPGETDPRTPDGQTPTGAQHKPQPLAPTQGRLSPSEVQRYLQQLGEVPIVPPRPQKPRGGHRPAKDW